MMIRRLILSFLLITTVVACSSEQSPDQSAIAVSQTDEALFKVSGVVTKGPINNALLEIIAFDANDGTESGTPLATTTTDANGNWTVSITPAPTVPLLIKASGGTFIDESDPEPVIANKRSITFGPSESLMGVLYPGFNTASVNILTSAMIEKSRTEAAGTNFLNVLGNNRNIATSALGFDPFTVAATNPLIPAQNASADAIEYAMYLGGIATALNTAAIKLGVAVPDYNIVSHFIQDLSDGVINGVNQVENPLLIDVGNGNVNFPSDINLNNAITRFRNNNYSAYAATSVTDVVTINTALMQTSGVNNEPTAIDDAFATVADTPLITGDVLANDSDPDGDALTISTFTQSANGTVADNGDGSFTFTPTAGFTGNAIFSYTVDDNKGGLDTAQVVVAVSAAPNDDGGGSSGSTPPVANAGADQNVDEQITVNLSGSATDSDGTVTGYSWSQVSGSPVTINNANSANASFDSPVVLLGNIEVLVFQLIATDDSNTDGFDFMTVLVNPVLVDPIADAGPDQTLNELLTVNLDATGSNDGTDGTISSYSWTQLSPVSPVVVFSDPGSATPSFTGPDIANDTTFTFQVTVTDNEGGTATDTVDVTLTSLNAGPTVVDDPSEVAVEDTVTQFTTLLNNDSDPESHTFTINSVSSPTANGGAVIIDSGNTSVTYTPAPNFNGTDTFTYTAIDQFGALSTNSATVTILVAGVNDDPVAVDDSASVTQGFPITITNLMVNDSDPEGDTTNISGVTQGSNGSVVNNFDGSVTYTPNLSFNGDDTFTYTIVDGNGGSDTASVTVTVIPDTDGDGLIDSEETSTYSTNPNIADSDSDGFNDRHEVLAGTNPNDILEFPPGTVISTGNSNNTISSNTTWDLASSPYWVQNDVTVNGGATLTIEAGVVVKFNNNTIDLFVTGNATLDVLGNAPIPQNVRFTSIFDDSIQGDTGGVVGTPAAGNWRGVDFQALSNGTLNNLSVRYGIDCIAIDNSSPQLTGVEVGDCSGYGIYTYSTTTSITSYLRDITVTDFDLNNTSTGNVSVWLGSANSTTNTLDIQNVIIDESNTYSVEIVSRNTSNISGSFDDLMVTNSASYGLYIHNDGTGNVDPLLSNISLTNPDSITISHLYIDNNSTGTLSPSFNGTNVISGLDGAGSAALNVVEATPDFLDTGTWSLSDTGYGIVLNGGAGNYNNINIDSVVTAGLLLQAAADPAVFDDVVLTNAFTPYELGGQTITSTISSGYDFSDPSVTKEYIRVGGSLLADTVFTADPLDAIATYGLSEPSIWRVISSLTVPALVTLTVDDGAIVKFDGNHSLNVNGSLIVGDGDGSGPNAVFTSFSDDDYGGDSNNDGASSGIWSDWNQIRANVDGSVIDIDNAIIRYSDYGVVQNNIDTATFDITNTSFLDIYLDGLYLRATNGDTINWNLNNIVFDRVGVNTAYHVFNIVMSGNSTLDGNWFGLTINDTGGDGIYLEDASSGAVTPIISGLTIGDSGLVGRNGVYLIGDSTTEPVFNATSGSGNSISGGNYNLALDGVSGSYSNLTLDGAANAAIYISGTSINPTFWEDSSIILTGGEAPYQLLVDLPSSIGVLGDTGNLGFNTGSSTVPRDYIALGATSTNSINLVSNPLGTDSVYRATSNITVLAGSTLSMQDGAILKMNSGLSITVNGSLIMGDGGPDTDPKSIITSINDSVGGDTNGSDPNNPAWLDWNRITVGEGSTIDIDNAIIRYGQYAMVQNNTDAALIDITRTDITDQYYDGLYLRATTGDTITWNLDTVSFTNVGVNTAYNGIDVVMSGNSTLGGTWNGLTINATGGDAIYLEDNSSGTINPTISGLTIGDVTEPGRYGIYLIGGSTTQPTFNNSSGSGNTIFGGDYNLLLAGVRGNYSDLTMNSAGIAAIYFRGAVDPNSWTDNSIILNSGRSPYRLLTDLPSSVGVLGVGNQSDIGFNYASSNVDKHYVVMGATSGLSDITLVQDPLDTGASVYRADVNVGVPAGVTLALEDGAILKSDLNVRLNITGSLIVGDGDGTGNSAIFTSIFDDAAGGNSNVNDPTDADRVPAAIDWDRIRVIADGSVIDIDNAIIRYNQFGVEQSNTVPTIFEITNSAFTNVYYSGLYLRATTGDNIVWNLDNVSFSDVSVGTSWHGLDIQMNGNSTLSGNWFGLTMSNNIGGSGIYIQDNSSGIINPVISGLTIEDTANLALHGVQLIGDSTTQPTFNGTDGLNQILAGTYNLTLQGVAGSYSDMLLENAGLASIYISNNANPSSFDGASITIGNSPSAYALIGMAMPSAITSNPYQVGSGLFTDYGMIWSSLTGDLTLGAPLQANYWRVYRDLDVPNGTTLTIEPGTLLKFEEAYDLRVLSGGTLNVNGTSGNEVVMTSFTDTNVGVANASLINDWEGVRFDAGSAGTVNYLTTWYGRDGVYITNSSPTFNNLTVNYSGEGVRINSTTNTSPVFNTMAINECSSTHLYLEGAGTLNPTFSGNLTITDISGSNATWGIYTTSADTTTISGFTITGSNRGVEIAGSTGANRIENNIITRAANYGIYHTADGNPWIRNNIITNNGSNTGSNTGGGIWVNGGNGIIFGNLIRDNRNYSGGGIRINNSSISLENNLIIENRSTSNTSNAGGSGVYVTGNGTSTINNNTIAFNTSADTANEGAGITFEMSANVTLTDNIIYGNTDGNSAAHDVYYESGTLTNNNNLIGTIIGGGSNLFSADASDIVGADPLFTDGWYLSTLTDQGTDSPAIDAGSVFATAVTPFPLDSLTTQSGPLSTDNDGSGSDGPDVNLGYHYASSAPVVSAANTLVTASPDSSVTPVNGSVSILITVTPRNGSSVVIGAGLDVVASAGSPLRLGTVVDRGDGTYQVTYLTPAAATGSDTVSFTVNGESIDTNININWIP